MAGLQRLRGAAAALSTFASIRRASRLTDRQAFLNWQARKLEAWLAQAPRHVGRYAQMPPGAPLDAYPVIDKARLMADFAAFNRPGITAQEGWAAFEGSRMIGNHHVGASTGTSGNRGLYVISDEERHAWLGAILAKTLPDIWKPWTPRERVAVILPLHTRLYDTANGTGRISLRFYNLTEGPGAWSAALQDFAPTTIIAPPKILRWIAENWRVAAPRRIFSGAEVLDPIDKEIVETRFGCRVGQIYMATEGLIAVSCSFGRLHLCEDVMKVELEPVPDSTLVSPIITDFRRTTQVMPRYRMNDLLRLDPDPCPCGSPCRAISEVAGRQDDVFRFRRGHGEEILTPDVLRNAVVDADRRIQDFRIIQASDRRVELHLEKDLPVDAGVAAIAGLNEAIAKRRLSNIEIVEIRRHLEPPIDRKLRRVERRVP